VVVTDVVELYANLISRGTSLSKAQLKIRASRKKALFNNGFLLILTSSALKVDTQGDNTVGDVHPVPT